MLLPLLSVCAPRRATRCAPRVICAALCCLSAGIAPAAETAAPPPPTAIAGKGCSLNARDGLVELTGPDGSALLLFEGARLAWEPAVMKAGTLAADGADTLRADYQTFHDPTGKVRLQGWFTLRGDRLAVKMRLQAPEGVKIGGTMLVRRPGAGGKAREELYKSGRWVRHAKGGVPYEVNDGVLRGFDYPAAGVWEVVTGNQNWGSDRGQHLSFAPAEQPGTYLAQTEYFVTAPGLPAATAAARRGGRPFSVTIGSPRGNHLWDVGEPDAGVFAAVTNAGATALEGVRLTLWARDFDGRELFRKTQTLRLPAGETARLDCPLPTDKQQAFLLEASAQTVGAQTPEVFCRDSAVVLAPYRFDKNAPSIFGMSAHFRIPDEASALRLLDRIGVRLLRSADNRTLPAEYKMTGFFHNNYEYDPDATPQSCAEQRNKGLDAALARQAPYWELGNEHDFVKKPEDAPCYVQNWLKPAAERIAREKLPIRMLSMGFANGFHGIASLKAVQENGGWPYLDGIAYHLGRGNTTPDYPGGGWSYLGSLRELKKLLRTYGEKPIYLTEVYAVANPNDWWSDSVRRACENILLTYALALAEGVKGVFFYQFNDSVWHDIGGVDEKDREYRYGLLTRQGTAKPLLAAYFTAARTLDAAAFQGYLQFEDPNLRGISFTTASGPVAILWSRADGYFQTQKTEGFAEPEVWLDRWKTSTPVTLAATGAAARVLDCIGQERSVAAAQGKVTLSLSGEPLIVYGLTLEEADLLPAGEEHR